MLWPMNLEAATRNWTELGKNDPLWAILTDPDKKGNRWDEKEFFATGETAIAGIFEELREAGHVPAAGKALDFGCGVGRLTQALAGRFASVDGVDISSSMVSRAGDFNRHPDRVRYHLNVRSDLATFPAGQYDFICSLIALQHTPSRFQRSYLTDFFRLLRPGGVAYFQTIHATFWRSLIPEWAAEPVRRWRSRGQAYIPMYGLPARQVRRIFDRPGGRTVSHKISPHTGWESRYSVDTFIMARTVD
jgi:2-polyprenyl-3-methyl-5-hydroxy-6-metoxy-1,4-benzoquinol methylase